MGNPAGIKRNFDLLEKRRMQAAVLLRQGIREAEVARRVGVHRQSVNRWARQLQESGVAGLKKAGRAGRRPRLSEADLNAIRKALENGTAMRGHEVGYWTTRRVTALIKRECGVRYHAGHVWRILRKLGWSCRRPSFRSMKHRKASVRRWIKNAAERRDASLADVLLSVVSRRDPGSRNR